MLVQVRHCRREYRTQFDDALQSVFTPYLRIGKKVANQRAHAAGPGQNTVEVPFCCSVRAILHLLLYQLSEDGDGSQRFLQIVAGRKCELLQIFIRPLKFLVHNLQLTVRMNSDRSA